MHPDGGAWSGRRGEERHVKVNRSRSHGHVSGSFLVYGWVCSRFAVFRYANEVRPSCNLLVVASGITQWSAKPTPPYRMIQLDSR